MVDSSPSEPGTDVVELARVTDVLVHKFVCRGTVEDKIDQLACGRALWAITLGI